MTVKSGDRSLSFHTLNLSPFGAKVQMDHPVFEPGTPAELRFEPPGGRPFAVHAIVWRVDPDGSAFFFIGVEGEEHSFPMESWPADSLPG